MPTEQMSPRKAKLKARIRFQTYKLKKYRRRIFELRNTIKKNKNIEGLIMPLLANLSNEVQTFILMQVKGKKRNNGAQRKKIS